MPFLIALPLIVWLAHLFATPFAQLLHAHVGWLTQATVLYVLIAVVATLAGLMRQWSWWYWLGLSSGLWFALESALAAPLSAQSGWLLQHVLPWLVALCGWLLSSRVRPPLWTPAGIIWLAVLITWPWLLLNTQLDFIPQNVVDGLQTTPVIDTIGSGWLALSLALAVLLTWTIRRIKVLSQPRQWAELFIGVQLVGLVLALQYPFSLRLALVAALLLVVFGLAVQMLNLAYIDELTQIPGRRALYTDMRKLGRRSAVTMLDVDHFKKFNDTYGHDVGDQVLKLIGSQLEKGRGFKCYRYGGEEFTLLFNHQDSDRIEQDLEAVRTQIANYPLRVRAKQRPKSHKQGRAQRGKAATKSVRVTVSMGCALRQPKESEQAMIKRADTLLYKAKKAGRNCVVIS